MVAGQTPYIHFGFVPSLGVDAYPTGWKNWMRATGFNPGLLDLKRRNSNGTFLPK
jgi:hypothetical protein